MNARFAWICGVLFLAAVATAQDQYEIIVESDSSGQNAQWFSVVDGKWMPSASKSKAPGLAASKALFKTAGSPGAARFAPDLPAEGTYEVFATYPDSGNALGVIYKIHSAEGDKEIIIDQRGRDDRAKPPANTWFSLGKYRFAKGRDGYVEVRDPGTGKAANEKEPNVRIYADAVKWVPVGFALPAQFAKKPSPTRQESSGMPRALPEAPQVPGLAALPPANTPQGPSSLPPLGRAQSSPPAEMVSLGSAGGPPSTGGESRVPSLPPLQGTQPSAPESLPALSAVSSTGGASPSLASSPSSLPSLPSTESTPSSGPAAPNLPALSASLSRESAPAESSSQAPALAPLGESAPAKLPQAPSGAASTPGIAGLPAAVPPLPSPQSTAAPTASLPSLPTEVANNPPLAPGAVPTPPLAAPPTLDSTAPPGQPPAARADLPWVYDEGSAHTAARTQNKKVLVFFVADGNRVVEKYEKEYFAHPAVRQVLSQFVLRKVNFPQNTRAGYKLQIYGAGAIAVTNGYGERLGAITQIPSTPEELAAQLDQLAKK